MKEQKGRGLFIPRVHCSEDPICLGKKFMVDFHLPKETQAPGPGVMEGRREIPQSEKTSLGRVIDSCSCLLDRAC